MGDKNNSLIFFITGNDGDMLKNHIKRPIANQAVKVVYALIGIVAGLVSNPTLHRTLKLLVEKDEKIAHMPVRKYNSISTIRLRQWKEVGSIFLKEISLTLYEMVCMRGEFCGGIRLIVLSDLMNYSCSRTTIIPMNSLLGSSADTTNEQLFSHNQSAHNDFRLKKVKCI